MILACSSLTQAAMDHIHSVEFLFFFISGDENLSRERKGLHLLQLLH